MPNPIRFILALHDHQPIGNFDHVFRLAYQDAYQPFLDLFSQYPSLKIALHTSGSLLEWLDANQPDYVDRLAELAAEGRLEVIGGAFYEPILPMVPRRDRIGQIRSYTHWLEDRLDARVRGAWVPERVWEPSLASDLVDAGIDYTILDDFHFKNAGLTDSQLACHLVTEDEGRVLSVLPGSERLRYLIPFGSPQQTIDYLAQVADEHPNAIAVFGDDGEKFGTWPETKKHVYDDGWLKRFFDAIVANQEWIHVTTPSEVVDNVPPAGKIYLPDSSYREMTEWALPTERLAEYERIAAEMEGHPHWAALRPFVRGGFWRNFRVKYPEADEMYCRMMMVSRRLQTAAEEGAPAKLLDQARTELYRGQCNCAYWHGAFGGVYLPHLRGAVYNHLIAADNLLDRAAGRPQEWIEGVADDFDFDTRQEIRLANDKLIALIVPHSGGHLVELDVRAIRHNLLATLGRRPEAYHSKVLSSAEQHNGQCDSIHNRVVFKQQNLDQKVRYDDHPRKSLVDLFYDNEATLEAVVAGEAPAGGDFLAGSYDARLRRNPGRIQVQMVRQGTAYGVPLTITKALTLDAGSSTLLVAYLLEGLPQDHPLHFAVEFNFAGMPADADGRFFYDAGGNNCGRLDAPLDLADARHIGLSDQHLGLNVELKTSRPTRLWTFPVETVSQSEAGFELIPQSVAVIPHWLVQADEHGRWGVTIHLAVATACAENHVENHAVAATT